MTEQDTLAGTIEASKALLARFLAGFDESNRTRQAEHLPNHLIWLLGHAAITMQRGGERIDGRPPAESDFAVGARGAADGRYDPETVAFNSRPTADAARYPSLARGVAIFDAACDRLAAAVRALNDAGLERTIDWGTTKITLRGLAQRIVFHNGFHAGQISDLRRALGLERVIR